jgi:UDP-glucose 4,6-dehydratase
MILILGKNGYVSKRFQDFFNYKNIDYKVVSLKENSSSLFIKKILEEVKPKFVINCMGYTGVPNIDSCEEHKEECLYVNVILAEILAEECSKQNIPLGMISSGCIYQNDYNEISKTYSEKDVPNFSFLYKNCSWYSGCKALGESLVKKSWDKSYIWRLRMPFNHLDSNKNYLTKILQYEKAWSCSNSISNLDEFIRACYQCINTKAPYGIYNIVNHGSISAKTIHELAKKYNMGKESYYYFSSLEEFNKIIKSPRSNCILDTSKIKEEGIYMIPIEESIEKCFQQWNKKEKYIFW